MSFASHTCLSDELHYLWLFLEMETDFLYSCYNLVACATQLSTSIAPEHMYKKVNVHPRCKKNAKQNVALY